MAKNLIIVESPAKVRTIKKILGRDYQVEASVGHVRDLPAKSLGVDEQHDFTPDYQVIPAKRKVVGSLKKAADAADNIYLAPDPDREGEAIAWHVAEIIKAANKPVHRIQFNEITPRAVREALENPRDLDEKLFHSQQARRILDRLVGYKLSPLLWKKIKQGISAGRVQSVALRLIVDREMERRAFIPEEYWLFKANLKGSEPPPFTVDLWKVDDKKAKISSADEAETLEKRIADAPFTVAEVKEKKRKKSPPPPYITSTMQQEASRRLGFSAKKTMSTAQRLYEGVELGTKGITALITYMRTDSVRIADEARDAARQYILAELGEDYYPNKPRVFKTKAGAQDAHEAIRPVDPAISPETVKKYLPRDQFRLYTLIWQRFLASQMAEAVFWDTILTVAAGPTLWRVKGERILFPGYLKVYGFAADLDDADENQTESAPTGTLPKLAEGETLDLVSLSKEQKFTLPPPRYTEASLVKELEDKGIGRPSTYASIISTLQDRNYVSLVEKKFVPSELGVTVADMLVDHFQKLMDVGFTASMEELLDQVAEGKQDWVKLLKNFTEDFYPTLKKAQSDMAKVKATGKETPITCELCGKPMVIRFGSKGEFLGCSGFPACKNTTNFERDEKGEIKVVKTPEIKPEKVGECPKCGADLHVKTSRTGSRFIACSAYPDCTYSKPFSTRVPCPKEGCPGTLVEKSSRRGKIFYSCDQYPECDTAFWDWPIKEPCPECGFPLLVKRTTKARGQHLACPQKSCRYIRELEPEE